MPKIKCRSKEESQLIAKEFLKAARDASEDLPLLIDVTPKDRHKHGWKHVTYEDVKVVANKALNPPAAAMRLEKLPLPQIIHVFAHAARREPRAVARLTSVFPDDDERQQIARYYLSGDPLSEVGIVSAAQLAAECVKTIYRYPNAPAAQQARRKVEVLISKKAATGQEVKAGKPGTFLLKSALYAVVLACFKILEEAAIGLYHGKSFHQSIAELGGGSWTAILTLTLLMFVVLIPFVGFGELQRVFGAEKLARVFFQQRALESQVT